MIKNISIKISFNNLPQLCITKIRCLSFLMKKNKIIKYNYQSNLRMKIIRSDGVINMMIFKEDIITIILLTNLIINFYLNTHSNIIFKNKMFACVITILELKSWSI